MKFWNDDKGWGVLTSGEVPGEVFAHFSHIEADGYRSLDEGERVEFDWRQARQDDYDFVAIRVAHRER